MEKYQTARSTRFKVALCAKNTPAYSPGAISFVTCVDTSLRAVRDYMEFHFPDKIVLSVKVLDKDVDL